MRQPGPNAGDMHILPEGGILSSQQVGDGAAAPQLPSPAGKQDSPG
jgi:hypothetical protein